MRRFSIATLMAVVLVCGVSVAALRDASDTWAGILLGLTLLMLGVALIGVLHRRGARRAFWQGFALFGWGYLALTTGPWASEQIGPRLPTTHLLAFLHAKMAAPTAGDKDLYRRQMIASARVLRQRLAAQGQATAGGSVAIEPDPAAKVRRLALTEWFMSPIGANDRNFLLVGHCLFALLATLVGGLIARWFQRADREVTA